MSVTMHEVLLIGLPAVTVLGAVLWSRVRQQAGIDRLDDRVAHLIAGTSLLTDTTEGALRDIAHEIGRLAAGAAGSARTGAAGQRRIATAARRGRTVSDIAATEELSESEVRLHLQLDKARKERINHASLR